MRDKVAFVLSISDDQETRNVVMDALRDNAPQWAEEIERRIIRIWTEQRGKQDAESWWRWHKQHGNANRPT